MKKVSLLILIAILASSLLVAAIPTKMVRLTIINKSGYDVYMKLEGSAVTEAYYYLTIPAGDRDAPTIKVFTIMEDVYTRTTWQCDGAKSTGNLVVDGNLRLTFVPCGQFVQLCLGLQYAWTVYDCNQALYDVYYVQSFYKQGEPRMEKVTYFKYLAYGLPAWASVADYNGFWNWGCFTWFYELKTYKLPRGCNFRYQY
jgi:hypothetical protein